MSLADNGRGYEMGLFDWLERRRIRKSFSELVSPEVIKLIEKNPSQYFLPPERKHFQWVLINLSDTSEHTNELAGKVVENCFRHEAIIFGIHLSLILATFGTVFPDDKAENRAALVSALLAENGDRIRIAHGQCDGLVGNIGCDKRWNWAAVIPGCNSVLRKLLNTAFGTAIEIAEAPAQAPAAAKD